MISVRRGITRGRALGRDQTVSSLRQHYPWCLIPQYHNQCRYSVRGNWCFTYMYNDKRKCPGVSKTISTQLHLEFCYWLKYWRLIVYCHLCVRLSEFSEPNLVRLCIYFLKQNIQKNKLCIYSAMRSGNNVLFG